MANGNQNWNWLDWIGNRVGQNNATLGQNNNMLGEIPNYTGGGTYDDEGNLVLTPYYDIDGNLITPATPGPGHPDYTAGGTFDNQGNLILTPPDGSTWVDTPGPGGVQVGGDIPITPFIPGVETHPETGDPLTTQDYSPQRPTIPTGDDSAFDTPDTLYDEPIGDITDPGMQELPDTSWLQNYPIGETVVPQETLDAIDDAEYGVTDAFPSTDYGDPIDDVSEYDELDDVSIAPGLERTNIENLRPGIPVDSPDTLYDEDIIIDNPIMQALITPAELDTTNVPTKDSSETSSDKKTSTQRKGAPGFSIEEYQQRAQSIKDKYKAGEVNRFQRNRLNRKLRGDMYKDKIKKKLLGDNLKQDVKGPVAKLLKKAWKHVKDKAIKATISEAAPGGQGQGDVIREMGAMFGDRDSGSLTSGAPLQLNPIINPILAAYQGLRGLHG